MRPRQVLPRRHFAAGAIGLALLLFGKLGMTATKAAERIGSWAHEAGAWRTIRRWVTAIDARGLFRCVRASPPSWSPRRRAERAAMTLTALAPETFAGDDDAARVFAGAALAS